MSSEKRSSAEVPTTPDAALDRAVADTKAAAARDAVSEASRYLAAKRDELQRQVAEIEGFLGFAKQSDDLAVRVAKLEAFIGMPNR